jgi:hypothetical protein
MSESGELRRLSPTELRREFHDLIVADLLGPAGGDHETLADRRERVSARYLVGMLAPRGTVAVEPGRLDDAGVDGEDGGSEAASGADLAAQASLFPSSIGLTFAVLPEVSRVRVAATWGKYLKEKQDGHEEKVWQRHLMEGACDIVLAGGLLEPTSISDETPGVHVRGRCTRGAGAWLVSLFLVNEQATPKTNKDEAWLFQPTLTVTADGQAVFVGRHEAAPKTGAMAGDNEQGELDLLFRHEVEFAVGHGVAVHAVPSPQTPARAVALHTAVAPAYEVARVEAPTMADEPDLANVVLDMKTLAETPDEALGAVLRPLAEAYDRWLDRQEVRLEAPGESLAGLANVANASLSRARTAAGRLRAGIDLVAKGGVVADAFRFSNRAMWLQRVHSVAAGRRRTERSVPFDDLLATSDVSRQRSWRPFQLAFLLVNLAALADPLHPERSPEKGLVDLLFFPTGGGKTEAYLGLTAFTLAIRRLQGKIAGHDGSDGLAVLMRYTLRLLTAQQFQRATALICACEVIRRERLQAGDARWGDTPFRIGMWVGSAVTPNYTKVAQKALDQAHGIGGAAASRAANPVQIVNCPWCGHTGLQPRSDPDRWRTLVFCGDEFGTCDFSSKKSPGEGIPVVTVDEEIYRLLPALVIATVDKFAQLPWQGPLHTLFGRVERRCPRHGYRSPDLDKVSGREERDSHTKTAQLPAAKTVVCDPLKPPDLIIQDELHLISGPLGTMVGLYESAIDWLASWDVDGHRVRPKVIASTATIRRAAEQVHALFWRQVEVFPPQVLDAGDSFFARRRPTSEVPGRLYLGVCAPGVRLKAVEARVFTTVLTAAQRLYEKYGKAADPWMTMVGYFNALRELGGARRIIEDDVTNRMRRADRKGLARRRRPLLRELTSRVSSGDIPEILDQLGVVHDPDRAKDSVWPIDVLLATNMISVGVDVSRLGLMMAVGQPKATAEYIQATSRVGRDLHGPGLVVTIYNWARPRDLSHYESFEHYHATFYRHVEALSVTPFSARALDRGLTGVLVAMARQQRLPWNPNWAAQSVSLDDEAFTQIADELSRRSGDISGDEECCQLVKSMLRQRLDEWALQQQKHGAPLAYRRPFDASAIPLLEEPTAGAWTTWTCPTSMREVEANVNFIMDTQDQSVDRAPAFQPAPNPAPGPSTNEDDIEGEVEEAERV